MQAVGRRNSSGSHWASTEKGEDEKCDWLLPGSSHPAGPPERPSHCSGMQVPPDLTGWPGARVGTLPASTTLVSFGALFIPVDRLPRHPFPSSVGPPEMRKLLRRRCPDPLLSPFSPFLSQEGGAKREPWLQVLLIELSSQQIHATQYIPACWGCGPRLLMKSGGLDGRALTHPVIHTASDPPQQTTNSGAYACGLRELVDPGGSV